jgi:ABC-type glycerol-3-phosphate transport system substrate-binding protein
MWRRDRNHPSAVDCRTVQSRLMAFRKGGLSDAQREKVRAHLTQCPACARSWDELIALESELCMEADRQETKLSPESAARIREEIQRRLRGRAVARRTAEVTGKALGFAAVVALLVGVLFLWSWVPVDGPAGTQEQAPGETPDVAPAAEPAQVVLQFAVSDYDQGTYLPLARRFEAENPGVEIRLLSVNQVLGLSGGPPVWQSDAWRRLARSADVIKVQATDPAVDPSVLQDLSPFLEAASVPGIDDFFPGTLAGCQTEDGVWCLPTAAVLDLIYFDKQAFDATGVPYPQAGWNWDDFRTTASALTERQGEEVTRWGFVLYSGEHLPFVERLAGPLVDTSSATPVLHVDDPAVQEALRWYVDLHLWYRVMPVIPSDRPEQQVALVQAGRAAMWNQPYSDWPGAGPRGNVGVLPYPGAGQVGPYDRVAISAGSAHPDVAWRWVSFLGEHVREVYDADWLPARRTVTQADGYWGNLEPELAAAMRYTLDHADGRESSGQTDRNSPLYVPFNWAVDAVLGGEVALEDALAAAKIRAQAAFERASAEADEEGHAPAVTVAAPLADPPGTTRIYFASGLFQSARPDSLGPYLALRDSFEASHPGIVVEILEPQSLNRTTLEEAAGTADCLVWSPEQDIAQLEGAVLDLSAFLDADPALSMDDFFPALVVPFVQGDRMWGVPIGAVPQVIKYNKDLFDAAGVAYPTVGWTMEDFLAAAAGTTQGEGEEKQYGFVGSPFAAMDLGWMLEPLGAQLVDDSVDPPRLRLDDKSVLEAFRWYVDLSQRYGVTPAFAAPPGDEAGLAAFAKEWDRLIREGRAGMWTILESQELWSDYGGLRVGMAPLPAGARAALRSVYGYYISAAAAQPQACWEWIRFLSGQPEAVYGAPARRSVAESPQFREQVGEERSAALVDSVSGDQRLQGVLGLDAQPWLGYGAAVWLTRAYVDVINGAATPEQALADAQAASDAYRACAIRSGFDAHSDSDAILPCLLETDPSLAVDGLQ